MNILTNLFRRKSHNQASLYLTNPEKLKLYDIVMIGVANIMGCSIYVVGGRIAATMSGPAIVLSFFIAAFLSSLAGLCYCELSSNIKGGGSTYLYTYTLIGELPAFMIGWILLMEYIIGSSSVARALTSYTDCIMNHNYSNLMRKYVKIDVVGLADYADLLAGIIIILLTFLLIFNINISSKVNNALATINILNIFIIIITGLFFVDLSNWEIPSQNITDIPVERLVNSMKYDFQKHKTPITGQSGFMPFGFHGVIAGAVICFYSFIGFDAITTTGNETKNAKRVIPIGIISSLFICLTLYSFTYMVLTLDIPYYKMNLNTPIEMLLSKIDSQFVYVTIIIGSICGIFSSLLSGMIPGPRILQSMAHDGMTFKCLSKINFFFNGPVNATIACGICTAIIGVLFDLMQLINLLSIGTITNYIFVALCVHFSRYFPYKIVNVVSYTNIEAIENGIEQIYESVESISTNQDHIRQQSDFTNSTIINSQSHDQHLSDGFDKYIKIFGVFPTKLTFMISLGLLMLNVLCNFAILYFSFDNLNKTAKYTTISVGSFGSIISMLLLFLIPQNTTKIPFKIPICPIILCFSISTNVYMMSYFQLLTWIYYLIWVLCGIVIYITYSYRNSKIKSI